MYNYWSVCNLSANFCFENTLGQLGQPPWGKSKMSKNPKNQTVRECRLHQCTSIVLNPGII